MTSAAVRLLPLGDAAVLVQFDGDPDATGPLVHGVAAACRRLAGDDPRFGAPVPGFSSVLVPVDPLDPGPDKAIPTLRALIERTSPDPDARAADRPPVVLPTRYGGQDGPDLEDVADRCGMRATDVVELHASVEYHVRFLGFAPGFAYLWRLPTALVTPRLDTPRQRVPAGSVAIAGEQTAVYPSAAPGGWRLLGRTDVRVWHVAVDPPALLLPGTRVRFVPVKDR